MSDEEDNIEQPFATDSDIFDAEIDSEPEPEGGNRERVDGSQEDQEQDEEENKSKDEDDHVNDLSEGEDTTKEDKKVNKTREPKKRKVKKIEVQKIHSDSQRLKRESTVKLPYHQPANRDIAHFLKRVPVNKKNIQNKQESKNYDVPEHPINEENLNAKVQLSSPPVGDIASNDDVGEPDNTAVKPKLSAATDQFFLDDSSTKKPEEVIHLMERFFKHSRAKTEQKSPEVLKKEPEEIAPPEILIQGATQGKIAGNNDESIKMKLNITISTGKNLTGLKEILEENMKLQRTKIRQIHESQRKIDNEEVSDEEEEEDFEDEDDTDFEVDEWNAEDDREQEERKEDEEVESDKNYKDNENHDTSDIEHNDESNSLDLSYEKTKLKNHSRNVYSDEQTMDLFSSDTSNQNTDKIGELTEDMNNSDSEESSESIKLRLDSVDLDSEDTNISIKEKGTDPAQTYTKLKLPSSFYAQESSDGSLISDAQQQTKKKDNGNIWNNLNTGTDILTPFSRIQKLFGVDSLIKEGSKRLSELSLPIEDSQDLYYNNNEEDNKREPDVVHSSKDFNFALDEDTQFTQFVDTQGYLLGSSKKNKVSEKVSEEKSNMSELLGLCSGTFSEQPKIKSNKANQDKNMHELLGLCSGKFSSEADTNSNFPSQNGSENALVKEDHNMSELLGLCSGHFSGLKNDSETKGGQSNGKKSEPESGIFSAAEQTKERKSRSKQGLSAMFDAMAEQDNFDDAVALCSGKFPTTQKSPEGKMDEQEDENENMNESEDGDSSDEDVFSDDADDEVQDSDDGNIDLKKSKKYGISYGKKTNAIFDKNNFLEEEAELSGSEFSSDEEEGCGDDELEEDSEVEDLPSDEELQRQVNKVHMKALIDEDKRDLRAFKERYLEDGDLYSEGGGRSRNFKWQGLEDSQLDLFGKKVLWGEEEIIDSELLSQAELERRKMKHEKDQFLQEQLQQTNNSQHTEVDENSQNILNLIKDTSNAASDMKKVTNEKPTPNPQDSKSTKTSLKRGSFLNRSKGQLSRLSSITVAKKTPNSTRGFVFHTISPGAKTKENFTKKPERSVSLSEPPNPKRPRLERTFSNIATSSLFSMI